MAEPLTKENAFGRVEKVTIQGTQQFRDRETKRFVSNEIGRVVTEQGRAFGSMSELANLDVTDTEDQHQRVASVELEERFGVPEGTRLTPAVAMEFGLPKREARKIENEANRRRLLAAVSGIVATQDIPRNEAKERLLEFLRLRAESIEDFNLETVEGQDEFGKREQELRDRLLSG